MTVILWASATIIVALCYLLVWALMSTSARADREMRRHAAEQYAQAAARARRDHPAARCECHGKQP